MILLPPLAQPIFIWGVEPDHPFLIQHPSSFFADMQPGQKLTVKKTVSQVAIDTNKEQMEKHIPPEHLIIVKAQLLVNSFTPQAMINHFTFSIANDLGYFGFIKDLNTNFFSCLISGITMIAYDHGFTKNNELYGLWMISFNNIPNQVFFINIEAKKNTIVTFLPNERLDLLTQIIIDWNSQFYTDWKRPTENMMVQFIKPEEIQEC